MRGHEGNNEGVQACVITYSTYAIKQVAASMHVNNDLSDTGIPVGV